MEHRGQKRIETVDKMPADKRACNSLGPSSSNSSVQTPMSSSREAHDADMDTSSSTSGSTRSEGDGEKESTYGSFDSESSFHDYYYRSQAMNDQSKFKKVLSSLSEAVEESIQLAVLTELCELLSFSSDSSLSSPIVDSLSPILVRLARHEENPDIMLLSIRAITYLCDVNPRSSGFLVRHDAVPILCQRLMVIQYLDVAEQCLQALEKISREQPLACLQSGAIMAVLTYIDFFSTSVQRVALSTVANICKKLSSESPPLFMEAVPILCNFLQYEDSQLVESAATCLIRIGDQIYFSQDLLDEVCDHGLVQHSLHLIGLNSRTTLCQPTYVGLIGLLTRFAAGSTVAFKTLLELNISNIVKEMLSTYNLSHGLQSTSLVDGNHSLINEVLKLLNELLRTTSSEQDGQEKSDKEAFLLNHPDITQKFAVDLLPVLIQVVNSGVDLFVCYGCVSVINKLVHFSTSDALHAFLQAANFSSFLAGVFARKDHHVMSLALQIVDTLMLKLPHVFLDSFIKEGVLFAIYALLSPDMDLKLSPVFDGMRLENDAPLKSAAADVHKCPCIVFNAENGTCKLQKDTVQNLAKHIWGTYFETESVYSEKGVTDVLQKLRALSSTLTALVTKSSKDVASSQQEEEIVDSLHEIMSELNEKGTISTFEFVESGIIKALVNYLSNGEHLFGQDNAVIREKRFEAFGRLLLSCSDSALDQFPLLTLIRRLQSALSSFENFPVISGNNIKRRNSYAIVPYGRCTSYPCLKVQFVKESGEVCLSDYTEDIVTVDPYLPLDAIEGYLWPRVSNGKTENKSKDKDVTASMEMCVDKLQEGKSDLFLSSLMEASSFAERTDLANVTDLHKASVQLKEHNPLQEEGGMNTDNPGCSDSEDNSAKLLFYLNGQQLNPELSLYQSILKQQTEAEHNNIPSASLWTHLHKITYRRHVTTKPNKACMFVSEADMDKLGPTYDILSLLKSLEGVNRLRFQLMSLERSSAFADGRLDDLDKLNEAVYGVSQNEFVNKKLTEKLEQQMRDPMIVSVGAMPAWCTQLMSSCPFLFGFEARCKHFHLAALGKLPIQTQTMSRDNIAGSIGRQHNHGNVMRKKFLVHRNRILESAAQMMELHACQKILLEVEYSEEVGTGLGPTLEFYTLVCREFQRSGLGMWRDDYVAFDCTRKLEAENSEYLISPFGLFPRPWSLSSGTADSEVIKKFDLLGKLVAKALQDGRVLDLPFSKAFYKLILGKELSVHDIQSFDPALGRALLEFQAVVERKAYLISHSEEISQDLDVCLRSTKIEDLCLDFTLPGYPDYALVSASDPKMVHLCNLEEYVTLVVDATVKSGINRQMEAFKSGFDQVFPIKHLNIFTEEELERLLCGEHVMWNSDELSDHIKFDHGYTISSPPIVNLLEIMQEFDKEQQRAFLQFVTGAPRLPTGGLASLKPKLTIVRKHCSKGIDDDLPSVMTCANYLKLPPYSSKEIMKEKLLYAITEGQGSFHLS